MAHFARTAAFLPLAGLTLLSAFAACGDERPPPPADAFNLSGGTSGAGGSGAGSSFLDSGMTDGPPPADADACTNEVFEIIRDRPNLYFVLDRSGSMTDSIPGGLAKYVEARIAFGNLLRIIGHRVAYGAALFPGVNDPDLCAAGTPIMDVKIGDPPSTDGTDGPVLKEFLARIGSATVTGGTPTSSTLEALRPTLSSLEGETFVLLATDGAPNCNTNAICGVDECIPNIEGLFITSSQQCDDTFNCCDEGLVVDAGANCIDRPASVAAVQGLNDVGIKTYVVGMPGSEQYATTLDQMAVAGGTAREQAPFYYAVDDTAALTQALTQIGVEVAITCDIELAKPPDDPTLVEVYFDSSEVEQNSDDGWVFVSDTDIELRGDACATLKSGAVTQVQVTGPCSLGAK